VRDAVPFDYAVGLLASITLLGYLIVAMLRPEKF
jgi:K+-transporting ATPase KdpF subunit